MTYVTEIFRPVGSIILLEVDAIVLNIEVLSLVKTNSNIKITY